MFMDHSLVSCYQLQRQKNLIHQYEHDKQLEHLEIERVGENALGSIPAQQPSTRIDIFELAQDKIKELAKSFNLPEDYFDPRDEAASQLAVFAYYTKPL